ncbi:hypothetical protein [Urbifossiella limnaea]|uniref:Uncharacterized protein n=1 Tax=Urbifossiella limnaea TaxID=2528023 RepID=A0A517XNM3_9BACT|nr:hypothetical protein [Urbifossiella limnaea]QDU19108.1 hypothetical protein ETAA1_10120 [Urbifossiella limnaea]
MFAALRRPCLLAAAVVLTVLGSAPAADAGWVTIQNDTGRVVVVQTTVTSNNQPRRGRPVRLLPGEHVREYHAAAAVQVEVFEGREQDRSLYCGQLALRTDPQAFSIASAGRGVTVTPAGR